MAYELIETIEVGAGGAASIEFTSIPQDGADLLIVYSLRSTANNNTVQLQINGSSASLTDIFLKGDGSSVSSSSGSAGYIGDAISENSWTSNTFSNGQIILSNYTASQNKSISVDTVAENNASTAGQRIEAMSWANTAAVTSFALSSPSGNHAQYSTASLFKIY